LADFSCGLYLGVLEFVLTGVIQHGHPQSAELVRRVAKQLKNEIACQQAKAVTINLLDFDECSVGDEIVGLFMTLYSVLARFGGGKIAIVAAGRTATSLDSILKGCRLDLLLGTTRQDLASALAQMTDIPVMK
jgi:GGDEF domain-containing protein